jgi:hypothetical protein
VATALGYSGNNKLFGDFKNVLSGNTSGITTLLFRISLLVGPLKASYTTAS